MILPRRTTYSILATLTILGIVFRYPLGFAHEVGSDTTFIHSLSDTIVSQGRAAWLIQPLSYFGLYPLSYPSAMPFLFAGESLIAGITLEASILITGFVVSVPGTLGAFLAARKMKRDDIFALLVATFFSFSPFYLKDTTWVGSSRGYVVALVPTFVALLLLWVRSPRIEHTTSLAVLFVVLGTIHRMGFFTFFLLVAVAFAVPFHHVTQQLRFRLHKIERAGRFAVLGSSLIGFVLVLYIQFLYPGIMGGNLVEQYTQSGYFQGSSFVAMFANMVVSLTARVGTLFPFALVGLVAYVWQRPKEITDKFVLTAVFVFMPLLSLRDYVVEFMIIFFAILLVLGLFSLRKFFPQRRTIVAAFVAVLLVVSVGVSWEMKDYWRNTYYTDGPIPEELYGTGVYVVWQTDGTILSSEGLSAGRIAAVSGRPILPIGGASIHWFGPQQLAFGFVNGSAMQIAIIPVSSLTLDTDTIFVPVNVPNAKDDYETIFYHSLTDQSGLRVLDRYAVDYVLVFKTHPAEFQSYIWRSSPFLVDAQEQRYKTYESPLYSIWLLG